MKRAPLLLALACACSTSINPTRPLSYPCTRDGGSPLAQQCPGGFTCGLDGQCHDPAIGFPYACNADSDCAATWRCGLNHLCHDRDAGAPYTCGQDSDCEQGWRCTPDGLCIQAAADSLRPGAGYGAATLTRVSPLPLLSAPDLFSIASSPVTLTDDLGIIVLQVDAGAVAWVSGGSLTHVEHIPDLYFQTDGGSFSVHAAFSSTVPLPTGSATAIATMDVRTFFLDSNGLGVFTWSLDGGSLSRVSTAVTGQTLRIGFDSTQVLVAFDRSQITLVDPDSGTVLRSGLTLPALDGGNQRLWDVAAGESPGVPLSAPNRYWVMAAGDDGLFVAYRTPNGALVLSDGGAASPLTAWQPLGYIGFPNRWCGPVSGGYWAYTIAPQFTGDGDAGIYTTSFALGVHATPWGASPTMDGGQDLVAVLMGDTFYDPIPACGAVYSVRTWGPCSPCPDGWALDDFQYGGLFSFQPPPATAGCVAADGRSKTTGSVNFYSLADADGGCYWMPFDDGSGESSEPGRAAQTLETDLTLAGANGELWSDNINEFPQPLALDHAPQAFFQWVTGGLGTTDVGTGLALEQPGLGLVACNPSSLAGAALADVAAPVEGRLSWVIRVDAGVPEMITDLTNSARSVVALFPSLTDSTQPFHATLGNLSDGGQELLVSVFDKLLIAPAVADAGTQQLQIKRVPLAFSPILSIATASPPAATDAGQLDLSGYVLTQDALFELQAVSPARWDFHEVTMPYGDWSKVWFDGQRGRIGYRSGAVYSLPSRVPIAPPLAKDSVVAFGVKCGVTYALTGSSLLELDPDPAGGPIGRWTPLDTSSVLNQNVDPGYAGGGIVDEGPDLLVYTAHGVVLRIRQTCPGP